VFGVLLMAVIGVIAWVTLRSHEPEYQGKPVSVWLAKQHEVKYGVNTTERQQALREVNYAIRQIGTNAMPNILRLLRADDTGLKFKLMGLAQKQHLIKIPIHSAMNDNKLALDGLRALGELASNDIPALIHIFETHHSPIVRCLLPQIFAGAGPAGRQAIPSLLRDLTSTNHDLGGCCGRALGKMHAQPEIAVPILIKLLHHSSASVRLLAMESLELYGADGKAAIPALIEILKAPDPVRPQPRVGELDLDDYMNEKESADEALKAIDPEAAIKAGVK
jgi:hypothetical protein